MSIRSEISHLKKVVIHNPGIEHHYTLPENTYEWIEDTHGRMVHNPDYLLFDDLISPSRMAGEHLQLADILSAFTSKSDTLHFVELLQDVVQEQSKREELLESCLALDEDIYGERQKGDFAKLIDLNPSAFVDVILSGRYLNDSIQSVFKWPLPNLIFTRDIAAIIGEKLLLTWGKREARKREMLLTKFIADHHPVFCNISTYDFHSLHPDLSIEGGDVIIFDENTVFIGKSERNSKEAIDAILPICFDEGFNKVVVVDLPKLRSIMHLDTIFSRISENEVLVYPPLFHQKEMKGHPISTYLIEKGQSIFDVESKNESLSDCLKKCGFNMTPIHCGGNESVFQEREQWSDGANAFTLEPGKIISYSRNHKTIKELKKAGYDVVAEVDFRLDTEKYIKHEGKMVITIDSAELPRGRGGPRCLTMPLDRA